MPKLVIRRFFLTGLSLSLKVIAVVMLLAQWFQNLRLARAFTFSWFFTTFLIQQALSALFYCGAVWGLARICDGLKNRAATLPALVSGLPWIGVCLIMAALPMFVSAAGNIGSEQMTFVPIPQPVVLIIVGISFFLVARDARRLEGALGQFV